MGMRGGCTPPEGQKQVPSTAQKNGYPSQKIHELFYSLYPLFWAIFTVHVSSSNQTEVAVFNK